jgi:WD40 repeat protein
MHPVVGRDGAVTSWDLDGELHRELWSIREPVEFLRTVPGTDTVVVGGASGALWLGKASGLTHLGIETARITSVACSYDARWLAIGTVAGVARLYDLATGRSEVAIRTDPWIGYLAFSRDSKSVAIATTGSVIFHPIASATHNAAPSTSNTSWRAIDLAARHLAFSPDGRWLAITSDRGDIWFHRLGDGRWFHLSAGTTRVSFGVFSDDSTSFAATDSSGRALLIDMRTKLFE